MSLADRLRRWIRIPLTVAFSLAMWLAGVPLKLATLRLPALRYRLLCRATSLWGYGVARIWGMRIRVEGPRPKAPFFLVSNHIGYTDIVLVCAVCPAWFISKAEVARWPGIGPLTRMGLAVYIDRESRRDVHRMNRLVADLVRNGGAVGFFPEGTTSDGSAVLPFKPSLLQPAIELGIPVTVAAISYQTPPGQPPPSELVAWVGDEEFAPHAMRLLAAPGFTATIRFSGETVTADNRKDLALATRQAVIKLLETGARDA